MSKNSNSKEKDHSKFKWFIEVFILTFVLSICFSYISTNGVTNLNLPLSILILVAVIGVGIIFDIIGVAVTVANEEEFHAQEQPTQQSGTLKQTRFFISKSSITKIINLLS